MNKLFGAIEGGGTKFICAVGTSPDDIHRETRISTPTPEETLRGAISFFKDAERDLGRLSSLGIATFGPIDPNPASQPMALSSRRRNPAGRTQMCWAR